MSSRFRWTLTNTPPDYPITGLITTEVLTKDPIGWDDLSLKLSRHKIYNGVFLDIALNLKWHCNGGGKEFIDNIYNTYDINANTSVLIEIDCDSSGVYSEFYTGKLNYASYETDGEFTKVNIEKSDLLSKLRSRDEINVDLETDKSIGDKDITPITPKTLQMHSQKIYLESSMSGDNPFSVTNTHENVINTFVFRGLISHSLTNRKTEAENFTGWVDYDDFSVTPGNTASNSFMPQIFEAIDDDVDYPATGYVVTGRFSGMFYDRVVGAQSRINTAHSLVLAYGADLATSSKITLYTSSGYSTSDEEYSEAFDTGNFSENIYLEFGWGVWLYWFESETITVGSYNNNLDFEYQYDNSELTISIDSYTHETQAKSVLIHEAFNAVTDAIADEDFKFYSEFYGRIDSGKIPYNTDGCGSKIAITNGFNIREFDDKNIFCNLKDLFSVANSLHNIGLTIEQQQIVYVGMEEVIRVEPISYFFDKDTEILSLAKPVKVETQLDTSRYYNGVKIGYDKWETEYIGGLDEPNAKHEYSTKINSVKNEYRVTSKYIASGYAIEATRRKDVKESTDWKYDNDNFVIVVKKCFNATLQFETVFFPFIAFYNVHNVNLFDIGETFEVTGTSSNDGTYTVELIFDTPNGIAIKVSESVTDETSAAVICDGETYSPERASDFLDLVLPTNMISFYSAYNLRITPMRMLIPHIKSIGAGITKVGGTIKFINGEGNTKVQTQINVDFSNCPEYGHGLNLLENDNFSPSPYPEDEECPLWLPEIYRFEYPISAAQLQTIRANPHGYITLLDDHNNTLQGYILDIDYQLKTGLTKFELLRKFDRYYQF